MLMKVILVLACAMVTFPFVWATIVIYFQLKRDHISKLLTAFSKTLDEIGKKMQMKKDA